ncbi:MAG: RDD family protein [Acidobacteriota bacterium]
MTAFLVDMLVLALVLVIPATVASYLVLWTADSARGVNLVWYSALLTLMLGVLFRDAWPGQGRSIGKRLLGLRLVTTDEKPCSPGRSCLRNLPLLIVFWNVLELYLVITGRQRTGDRLAGTRVLEE